MVEFEDGKYRLYYDLKYEPRQQQIDGVNFIKKAILTGNKYMLLNLPTGVGKSFLATMFINWYLNHINENAKFDVLTNSKLLQEQYIKEFPYIRNLKGRANYPCDLYNTNCDEGLEICSAKKKRCDNCPYMIALSNFIGSRVSMTNFHMFDIANIFSTAFKSARESNVLIVDEASDFDQVFCSYMTTELNINVFIKCGFEQTKINEYKNIIASTNDILSLIDSIIKIFLPDLDKRIKFLKDEMTDAEAHGKSVPIDTYKKWAAQTRECTSKFNSLGLFVSEFKNNPENWILETVYKRDKRKKEDGEYKSLIVQPVWGTEYIPKYALEQYDHIIFMSATILNKKLFCSINGLDENITKYYEIPSPFPVQNRPIYYIKAGKMTYKEKESSYQYHLEYIKKTLSKYKNDKGIIHTFNYELATWLNNDLSKSEFKDRIIVHDTANRNDKLNQHINSNEPTVIISPSMMMGVDLKDELSRFQIIMKIPYPNIQSKLIKKRQQTNPDWYKWKTIVDLVQQYGRSVRSDVDFADTIILDSCLSDIINFSGDFLPKYFIDAIKILKIKY
jgi:Rad3-related DNA helicase